MADEFGQRIQGLHQVGDTIVSTDRHIAVYGKLAGVPDTYQYLEVSASGLMVDVQAIGTVTVSGTVTATTNYEYAIDTVAGAADVGAMILAVRDDTLSTLTPVDGDYVGLRVNNQGALWVTGSLTIGANDSIYTCGAGVTMVKDTPVTIVTRTPASVTEQFSAVMVSGAGYAEWIVKFGTTGSENAILHFWTTPSHPTEYVDLPDYLSVTTAQTLLITGTNREKAASTASDFTGYATLIRKN